MSYYGVFHGARRESSKLKTALRKRPVCQDGFSFSAAPSYRYMPPCTSTQRSNHAKRDPAPILEPRSLRDLSTVQRRRKILVHRSCPRPQVSIPATSFFCTTDAQRRNRHAQHNVIQYESRTKNKQHNKMHPYEVTYAQGKNEII